MRNLEISIRMQSKCKSSKWTVTNILNNQRLAYVVNACCLELSSTVGQTTSASWQLLDAPLLWGKGLLFGQEVVRCRAPLHGQKASDGGTSILAGTSSRWRECLGRWLPWSCSTWGHRARGRSSLSSTAQIAKRRQEKEVSCERKMCFTHLALREILPERIAIESAPSKVVPSVLNLINELLRCLNKLAYRNLYTHRGEVFPQVPVRVLPVLAPGLNFGSHFLIIILTLWSK